LCHVGTYVPIEIHRSSVVLLPTDRAKQRMVWTFREFAP